MVFSDSQIGYVTVTLTAPSFADSQIGYTTITLTAPAPAVPKLRAAKVLAQGTVTNPKLRVSKVVGAGSEPLTVPAIPDQSVEAYGTTTVAVTGSYPVNTSFTWRQISGPPVTFVDNGTNITFTAPTTMGGTSVVFGVTATVGTQTTAEVPGKVSVLPHLNWYADSSTGVWKPVSRTTAV